jgi:hypothetical protein
MNQSAMKWNAKLTPTMLLGGVFGGCVGIFAGVLSSPNTAFFTPPNSAAPTDSLDLVVCITLLGVLSLGSGIITRRQLRQSIPPRTNGRIPLRRADKPNGSRFLRHQLLLVLALFVYFDERSWTAESVGIKQDNPPIQFLYGTAAYAALVAILIAVYKVARTLNAQADNNMVTMAYLWPRKPRQKLMMAIAMCGLNPVTEEILFRGILVYQFSYALGSYELPLLLGLLVSLANHAYQGLRATFTHALWYAVVVGLLFSEAGLIGAIVMHVWGDVMPVYWLRGHLWHYRNRHRRSPKPFEEGLPIPQIEGEDEP